jgi:hypothetical protein
MLKFEMNVLSNGLSLTAKVTASPIDQIWQLELELDDETYVAEGWECLDAFNKVRGELEDRYLFLCNGACPNFLLSPMTSQAGGLEGYRVPEGRKARLSDLVPIFDFAPAEEIGPVKAQSEFKTSYMDQVQRGELPD